jgi:hypothetical protein
LAGAETKPKAQGQADCRSRLIRQDHHMRRNGFDRGRLRSRKNLYFNKALKKERFFFNLLTGGVVRPSIKTGDRIMRVDNLNGYASHQDWFASVLRGQDLVLSHTSSLELLGLLVGYVNEDQIAPYATRIGPYENINCYLIDSFDSLDIVEIDGLRCASLNQTINDMVRDYDRIDEPSLAQGLSDYYHDNGESFEGLAIDPKYADRFEAIKDWAVEFYTYG